MFGIIRVSKTDYIFSKWFWELRSQPSQDFENHSILPHGIAGVFKMVPPIRTQPAFREDYDC